MVYKKPRVENKYHLTMGDIKSAKIINWERLNQKPFIRNDVIGCYYLRENTNPSKFEESIGDYSEYCIRFYPPTKENPNGRVTVKCERLGGVHQYRFNYFYNRSNIHNRRDLEIQEKLLKRLNWLIDEKIIEVKGDAE